jgi:hypothetical protein
MINCKDIRAMLMDYIYDEISETDREAFELHLTGCTECRKEVESLTSTSGLLKKWVEPEPDIRVIAVKEKSQSNGKYTGLFRNLFSCPNRFVFGSAFALLFIFMLFSIANTEISFNNGNFSMRMSFMKPSKPPQTDEAPIKTNQLVEELVRENYQLTRALIEQSEARQEQKLAYVLSSFKKELDEERYHDLSLVQYGMRELQKNTYQQVQEIDGALNQLIRPANINSN